MRSLSVVFTLLCRLYLPGSIMCVVLSSWKLFAPGGRDTKRAARYAMRIPRFFGQYEKMDKEKGDEIIPMEKMSNQAGQAAIGRELQKLSVSQVFEALGSGPQGLSGQDAQVRLAKYGKNVLREKKGQPIYIKFLLNFTHTMAMLLWVGGIVGFVAKLPELGVAIWLVNIINGLFSFWQEFRAGKATEALKKMLPSYARVLRDGQEQRVLSEDLVPGDILLLSEGDRISADGRLVEDSDLQVNQSTLTGESSPVRKAKEEVLRTDLGQAEKPNMIFSGTSVAAGTGKAVVYATGMGTEFGKIAGLTQTMKEEPSPLQKELDRLTKFVTILAVAIGVVFFAASVLFVGTELSVAFIFAMGMIVAFVPEGLLPTVTLALAMGVQRMARRNALIKRLSAVETLGCATVICTDKTGTLTQNEMTVSSIWIGGQSMDVTGIGYAAIGRIMHGKREPAEDNVELKQMLTAAGLCCNARLLPPEHEGARFTVLGDPTEAALLVLAQKGGIDLAEENRRAPRLRELPFDSRRKRMTTIHPAPGRANRIAYVKGAPKEVADLCSFIMRDGREESMTDEDRGGIMDANDQYARNGLRVLAIAVRHLEADSGLPVALSAYTPELVERDMTFLGLVAMVDPPREEVSKAVEKCRHAGIRIIMITGDYGLTAESIARRIGIVKGDHPRIITGVDLENMNREALKEALEGEVIFARVAPEQKLQVVSALQELGHVVAVTGDGVNDAPALKKADIGVAMGISGTDVAKEAADMILTDDNFASIVNAIEEGRAVYNNIRKFAMYIFTSNMPEAVPVVFYLFSRGAIPLPLTIMQVLAIDLGTDMVPAIALGVEAPEEGIMDLPPRSQKEPIVSGRFMMRALLGYGMIESVAAMAAFFFFYWQNGWTGLPLAGSGVGYQTATTMTLAAIVLTQIGSVFARRTERASVFHIGLFTNRLLLLGIAVELLLLCLLMYIPAFHRIFNTAPLNLAQWGFLALWMPAVLLVDEIRKAWLRGLTKRRTKNA